MDRFESLIVWQKGMDLVEEVYRLAQTGGLAKDWGLRNPLSRSSVSVPSKIAEGYERGGRKEFSRGLTIAKGFCGEVRTQLLIVRRLKYAPEGPVDAAIANAARLSAMIARLRAVVRRQKDHPGPPE